MSETESLGIHGTFAPNKHEAIHRWYPYTEGFSRHFVASLLEEFSSEGQTVHDPFAGTGTTVCAALEMGMNSTYCEVNPFMRLVIEAKVNDIDVVLDDVDELTEYFGSIIIYAKTHKVPIESARKRQKDAFRNSSPLFSGQSLTEILAISDSINSLNHECEEFRKLAKLALGSIAVESSDMIKRADLRRRKPKEMNPKGYSPLDAYMKKTDEMLYDMKKFERMKGVSAKFIGESALNPHGVDCAEIVFTSPPWPNGTNYFRNTKIELWLTGLIDSESDLKKFRIDAMAAGINTVSGRKPLSIQSVEEIATKLDKIPTCDKRIPQLIRCYFSDSRLWLENSYNLLKDGGVAIVDIGDSYYSKIHVPSDKLLLQVAKEIGFKHIETRFVRNRRSKDGTPLKQVIHILSK